MKRSAMTALVLLGALLLLPSCRKRHKQAEAPKPLPEEVVEQPAGHLLRRVVRITAQKPILHYREQLFWDEAYFSEILQNKDQAEAAQHQHINDYRLSVSNYGLTFNEADKGTIASCDLEGAFFGTTADFTKLLRGYDFDLYGFKQARTKLVYKGNIDGVPTVLSFEFPYSIGHCHYHVWPGH